MILSGKLILEIVIKIVNSIGGLDLSIGRSGFNMYEYVTCIGVYNGIVLFNCFQRR